MEDKVLERWISEIVLEGKLDEVAIAYGLERQENESNESLQERILVEIKKIEEASYRRFKEKYEKE